jgi:hypothetical protein
MLEFDHAIKQDYDSLLEDPLTEEYWKELDRILEFLEFNSEDSDST